MSAAENAGATADGIFDEIDHALDMMRTNHRADIGVGVIAGAEAQFLCLRDAAGGKFITYRLLDEKTLRAVVVMRRMFAQLSDQPGRSALEAMEALLQSMSKTSTNMEFLATLNKNIM